jgi:hypothetical protein
MLVATNVTRAVTLVYLTGDVMKKKPQLEADLDPVGARNTRPGAKIAESAVANAKRPRKRKTGPAGYSASRPGSTAAGRAVDATRAKPTRK